MSAREASFWAWGWSDRFPDEGRRPALAGEVAMLLGVEVAPRIAIPPSLADAAGDAIASKNATITHHHAVGRTHRRWYDRARPGPFAVALPAAKAALDPAAILNPGGLLDP